LIQIRSEKQWYSSWINAPKINWEWFYN